MANNELKPTSTNLNLSNLIEINSTMKTKESKNKKKALSQHNIFLIKNKLITDITHAIQLVQKNYLEKADATAKQMTNSDFQVHELCQHLDFIFLFGLKKPEDAYWKLLLEFTHKNFIQDLNRLLNVTTSFGKSRAWLYHALNENLMECYLKCISDDKKLINQFYLKDCSIIGDQQVISVLITLVSGLENVEFKLFNDVPYLDHSCWPTHFNVKRIIVDNLLNSTQPIDTNDINKLKQPEIVKTKKIVNKTQVIRRRRRDSNRRVNNVNLDEQPQITNYSDINKSALKNDSKGTNSTADEEEQDQNFEESESIQDNESDEESDEIIMSKREQALKIDNEIDKLRRESLLISNKKFAKKINDTLLNGQNSSSCSSFLSNNNIKNDELLASSLKATNQFDKKIEDLENYSQLIEDATRKMDDCFKDMNNVYSGLEQNYNSSSNNDDESVIEPEPVTPVLESTKQLDDLKYSNVFKELTATETNDLTKEDSNYESDFYNSTNETNTEDNNTTTSEILFNESNQSQTDSEDNYLTSSKFELKQEIKVDTNLKLMLMINVFQNGENEQLFKFYSTSQGHSQGEIENIYLLITSHGIYILVKNNQNELDDIKLARRKSIVNNNISENVYKKELYVNHTQLDYIEVGLEQQAVHMVCMNKRQSFWITTASRLLTENYLENVQAARQSNSTRLMPLSVFHEATQQRLALTKFISNEEKLTIQDIKINKYQLVFWEDQNSSTNQLIHKEGLLLFFNKSSTSSNLEWKTGYFVLKNDVLAQYKNTNDKRPSQIIKLNGEDFLNCRKNNNTSKPHTIELIFSNGNVYYLSAKSETDASDWLQIFCRVISMGNIDTDVPAYSCVPCCTVITMNKIYFCHEDLNSGFYRLLEAIKLQEINRISFDNDQPYFCILHDDIDNKKDKYWFVYFIDENERNQFITGFKEAWELLFQVPFMIERCKSTEMRKRCTRSVNLIHNEFERN